MKLVNSDFWQRSSLPNGLWWVSDFILLFFSYYCWIYFYVSRNNLPILPLLRISSRCPILLSCIYLPSIHPRNGRGELQRKIKIINKSNERSRTSTSLKGLVMPALNTIAASWFPPMERVFMVAVYTCGFQVCYFQYFTCSILDFISWISGFTLPMTDACRDWNVWEFIQIWYLIFAAIIRRSTVPRIVPLLTWRHVADYILCRRYISLSIWTSF